MWRDDPQPRWVQDRLSQKWVIATGRRVDPAEIPWLMGPYGEVDEIGEHHILRLAERDGLEVRRRCAGAGLLGSMSALLADAGGLARLNPLVARFYERTADCELDGWSQWGALFGPGGRAIKWLYSRRLQQLNLPQRALDTARGIGSEIVQLCDAATGEARYTVWHRTLKGTGQILYSGHYGVCDLPRGERCLKVVFPLPCGNATVILRPRVDEEGRLELVSSGEGFGDAGFYFLLRDKRGQHWGRYIQSFRERIFMFEDAEGALRTDHEMTLWGRRVLGLHYRIRFGGESAVASGERGAGLSGARSKI